MPNTTKPSLAQKGRCMARYDAAVDVRWGCLGLGPLYLPPQVIRARLCFGLNDHPPEEGGLCWVGGLFDASLQKMVRGGAVL